MSALVRARFDARRRGKPAIAIAVRFDPPRRRRGVWACRFEVRADRARVAAREIYGDDGLHALLGAMMIAVVHVERVLARERARIASPVWEQLRLVMPPELRRGLPAVI